jgi:RNA polymerase sigma-70 factor (ECF subfamily)
VTDSSDRGNRPGRFPETHWSVVLAAADDGPQGAGALEQLCRSYWYPIFAYLRATGHACDDAEDLTQAFFVHVIENRTIGRADQLKGTFRGFLIGALKHFLANERDRNRAQKRGGRIKFVSFDLDDAERQYRVDGQSAGADPVERVFDQRWAQVIVRHAMVRLRSEFEDDLRIFERLQPFLVTGVDSGSYERAAQDLAVSLPLVKSAIHRMRRRYREALRSEVAVTVSAPHEIDGELRYLIAVLGAE